MSAEVEEDAELRDLVSQTLETNGVLGKLRAQLRASVFLALDEQDPVKHKAPFRNQDFKRFASSNEGQQILDVVREFLQFFNLEYSLAVFNAEADCSPEPVVRKTLAKQLELTESTETSRQPLISEVLRRLRSERNDELHSNSSQDKQMGEEKADSVKSVTNVKRTLPKEEEEDTDNDDDFFIDSNRSVKDDKKSKTITGSTTPPLNSSIGGLLPTLPDKKLLRNEDSEDDDNEYEADFQLSNITPLGQTPRSARSDARTIETEEVSEEIEEEDELGSLIRSDASQLTELTTDRTVSPADVLDKIGKADYLEDVLNAQS